MENKSKSSPENLESSSQSKTEIIKNSKLETLFEEVSLDEQVSGGAKFAWEKTKYGLSKFNQSRIEFLNRTPLLSYSVKRILYAIVTLYLAMIVMYVLLRIVTPDSVYIADINLDKMGVSAGDPIYYQLIENRKRLLGVDGPLISQIFKYLNNITPLWRKTILLDPSFEVVNGNLEIVGREVKMWMYLGVIFGRSTGIPLGTMVQTSFAESMPVSFKVGALAVLLSYALGMPLGILAAKYKEKWQDTSINGVNLIILAIPSLVIIKILYELSIYYLGAGARWEDADLFTKMFPIIGVMLLIMPSIVVNTRRYVIDEMTADYTKFAMSKGLSNSYVFYVHVFRNASLRLVKNIPEIFILTMFGSSILVEQHWNIPGMSKFILAGVRDRDTFVVLGYIYVSAGIGIFANLLGDLALAILDPRVKLTSK
ncbi:oligopeptide ABC transporter permease [Spiroplasma clarkii]|uniref:Oligopeptide ABC transporter permease n=1 Tax=Spiroplasma clarkii TaxID=2139 RepID=A0A1Y0L0V7_9MOLU|nr:oligopeptide ABC transporter permease OppB [Spiroplasma clarkii]ARU91410.1 oligopeptide ABC transporter permease [Spiroplasma clarkii]ATX70826.1 oligopeptide ABC transporter permease [Spiroplasma clarkii]